MRIVDQIYSHFNRPGPKPTITISVLETSHDQESPPLETQKSSSRQVSVEYDYTQMDPVFQVDK